MDDFSLSDFAKVSCITFKPKSDIDWLTECGLDPEEVTHVFRDGVERQNTCTVIQVHSHPGGPGTWDRGSSVVILEFVAIFETV